MDGFWMNDKNIDKNDTIEEEKEMPTKKPEVEITNPAPSVVPSPKPDQIINTPKPEIIETPMESPSTDISEIGVSEIMEF